MTVGNTLAMKRPKVKLQTQRARLESWKRRRETREREHPTVSVNNIAFGVTKSEATTAIARPSVNVPLWCEVSVKNKGGGEERRGEERRGGHTQNTAET